MSMPHVPRLEHRIKAQAYGLGFDLAGIAPLGIADSADAFDDWVAHGFAGDMQYLERRADVRRDSRRPVPGATSAVVVALDYGGREPSGPVARYARGDDYHDVMLDKLRTLHAWIAAEVGHDVSGKAYVDTGPVLERDLARRAGLGWLGKNTMLINPRIGSYFFIGALFLALDLAADAPFTADHCGRCTRCLDACPTRAFTQAHVLDARRCISYLTIELRGEIPDELPVGRRPPLWLRHLSGGLSVEPQVRARPRRRFTLRGSPRDRRQAGSRSRTRHPGHGRRRFPRHLPRLADEARQTPRPRPERPRRPRECGTRIPQALKHTRARQRPPHLAPSRGR